MTELRAVLAACESLGLDPARVTLSDELGAMTVADAVTKWFRKDGALNAAGRKALKVEP